MNPEQTKKHDFDVFESDKGYILKTLVHMRSSCGAVPKKKLFNNFRINYSNSNDRKCFSQKYLLAYCNILVGQQPNQIYK